MYTPRFRVGERLLDFEGGMLVNVVSVGPVDKNGLQWYTVRGFDRTLYEIDQHHLVKPHGKYHDDSALRSEENIT